MTVLIFVEITDYCNPKLRKKSTHSTTFPRGQMINFTHLRAAETVNAAAFYEKWL